MQVAAEDEPSGDSALVRAVPALVVATGLFALAGAMVLAAHSGVSAKDTRTVTIGPVDLVLVFTVPSVTMVVAGLGTALAVALLVNGLDAWAARRVTTGRVSRRQARELPLRYELTTRRPKGPVAVTALIPACNEEAHLAATLVSLRSQTRPPTAVWVIADNCTDSTEDVARAHGVNVYTTVDNSHRKAGGLNQLLARLLPGMGPLDVVLVMDADTIMVEDFLERAVEELEATPDLDAVGGVFFGDDTPGLLGDLQRNEYRRYSRDIARRQGRVFVLTGTASLFRADALAAVAEHRGTTLPGTAGHVYDTISLTEDNELTLALKTLGARLLSPQQCQVRTELMPTWKDLWHQRQRWQRGALENIGMYGVNPAIARYWLQQFGLGYGVIALFLYLAFTAISWVALGVLTVVVFWFVVGLIFAVERVCTVWEAGWRARLLAGVLVIELGYAVFLQVVYVKSLLDIVTGQSKHWNAAKVEALA